MSLSEIGRIIRRRWIIVVATALACAALASAYVLTIPTTYTATTRLYVSMATGTSVNDSYQGGLAAQQRITSYSHIAGGITVAERVIRDLGLSTTPEELQSRISVAFPPASALLDISATDSTPEGARLLADKVAAQFRKLVSEIETTTIGAAPAAEATVIDPAVTPDKPNGPHLTRLLAIGLFGGLALGCLAAFVLDGLDRRLRRPEQLAGRLAVPVLASVPGDDADARKVLTRLRARLVSGPDAQEPASLLLTSASRHSVPGVAIGLSEALAATGRRVVLVDADVSGNGVSARLGMVDPPGLAEWLRGEDLSRDELLRPGPDGLVVVPLGAADEHTSDRLDSPRLAELQFWLQARFDHVVVDTAPMALDAAAVTLAPRCTASLVVAELGTSSLSEVRTAVESLGAAGPSLTGVVVAARAAARERRQQRRRERSAEARRRPSLVSST